VASNANEPDDLDAGAEPGLRFALTLDGTGCCRYFGWEGLGAFAPERGFLWVHLERDTHEAARWLQERSGIDPLMAEALLAEDSRPRVEAVGDDLLVVLRGVNLAEKLELELVPLHVWFDRGRLVTLRDRAHALSALRDIRLLLKAGRGPRRGGGLLVLIAEKIGRDLEPVVDAMEVEMERLEDAVLEKATEDIRRHLAAIRRKAVHLRRYLGPQREALRALRDQASALLDARDRLRLRGVIDRVSRHLEDLDAIRDRTAIVHEDLAAVISERIAKTTHRFTAIAALLLPPSLIAGILGANIGGIPGQQDPYAFLELVGVIVLVLGAQWLLLRRIRWL